MITAVRGERVQLRGNPGLARLELEDGRRRDVDLRDDGQGLVSFRAPATVGYHRLEYDDGVVALAVAPRPRIARRAVDASERRLLSRWKVPDAG